MVCDQEMRNNKAGWRVQIDACQPRCASSLHDKWIYTYRHNVSSSCVTTTPLNKKTRRVLAALAIVLVIYQRQRILQRRAMEHEEQTSTHEPPTLSITYIHQHGWTLDNPGGHFFHDEGAAGGVKGREKRPAQSHGRASRRCCDAAREGAVRECGWGGKSLGWRCG